MAEQQEELAYVIEGEEPEKKEPVEEETPPNDEDDESSESGDEESSENGSVEEEDDREAIRARRREERRQKKEAQKDREASARREKEALRRENETLAQRLAILERRSTGSEMAQLDTAIEQTQRASVYLKEQIKLATEANDGATVADATEKLYKASRYLEHLSNIKQNASRQVQQQASHSPIDPATRRHAEGWMTRHNWYDPSGSNPDSKVALTIDQSLAEEGWDPRQQEYWEELDSRLKKYLPHRYQGTQKRTTTSPVTGSGRESGGTNGGAWVLSKERVQAIKEAGAWDDVAKRDKMIRTYREYDKQHRT